MAKIMQNRLAYTVYSIKMATPSLKGLSGEI